MRRNRVVYRKRARRVRLRRKKITFFLLGVIFLVGIGLGVNSINVFNNMTNRDSWATSLKSGAQELSRINYLVIETSKERDEDVLQGLYLISNHDTSPYTLFLPGNTLVGNGETFQDRYQVSGAESVVNSTISLIGEPVNYYFSLDYSLFHDLKESQDLIGEIPKPYYTPSSEEMKKDVVLTIGNRNMNAFTLISELIENTSFWRWPSVIKRNLSSFETNLSWREINSLLNKANGYTLPDTYRVEMVPGKWVTSEDLESVYFEIDNASLAFFFEILKGGVVEIPREEITVEILNGSGVPGLAGKASSFLEKEGFNVINTDNADHFDYQLTQVISRLEDVTPAKEVAVSIQGAQLLKEVDGNVEAMVTVIIGSDFNNDLLTNQ